jgi:hypothetical protein
MADKYINELKAAIDGVMPKQHHYHRTRLSGGRRWWSG